MRLIDWIAVPDTLDVVAVTLNNATVAYRLAAGTVYLTEAAEVREAHIQLELQGKGR